MVAEAHRRAREDIVGLVRRGLTVAEFARHATHAVGRGVPFDGVCLVTFDPTTGLPTGEYVENGLPASAYPRLTQIEVSGSDVNTFAELASRPGTAASLSAATGGCLDRSVRHRELRRPAGFDDELRAALIGDHGAWGALTLMRRTGSALFTAADVAFVASISRLLAEGLRRALLFAPAPQTHDQHGSGLLVLADDDSIELANAAARRWLDEIGPADDRGTGRSGHGQQLPAVVRAVAQRARADATAGRYDGSASARVRTPSGRWLLARGSMLGEDPSARAAVIIDPAQAPDLGPLIAEACGLTGRECRITRLVADGLPTAEIATRLHLSPYTVQDHLKAIFDKTGVGTRGELVALLFIQR